MAIQKEKTLPNGVIGNYWRILSIVLDRESCVATGRIALYKDKATADAGGTHLGVIKSFTFSFTVQELLASPDAITYAYSKIIARANAQITVSVTGETLDTPRAADPDLAGGTNV